MELPDSPPAELEPAAEPAPESIGEPEELCSDDADPLGEDPGELGVGEVGELPTVPPELLVVPVSPLFLERFVPELLSLALFLHAARPTSGTIAIMASNVFNDIDSPPFVEFKLQRNRCSFTSSSGAGWVNPDVYWMQVNLRLSADAPAAVEDVEFSVGRTKPHGTARLQRRLGRHARDPAPPGARDVDEFVGA